VIVHSVAIELAFREAGGIEIALLWHREAGTLTVVVGGAGSSGDFELVVDEHDALDAFYHPYAHAARRGVQFDLAAA
jgi:hypothetical protein